MRSLLSKPIAIVLLLIGVIVFVAGALYLMRAPEVPEALPVEPVVEIKKEGERSVIGTSVEGRAIEAVTYGEGERSLLFVGGVHGGYEWNSVLLAYRFIDHLDANPQFVATGTTITVIPSLNPDGVFKVTGKEGRFSAADVPKDTAVRESGRFNARAIDLNRNFACKWKPESMWRGKVVSAGTAVFSEPEAKALRDLVTAVKPDAVVFWHSQANAVYASECEAGILPLTRTLMNAYAKASGYTPVEKFDAYEITGDAEGWLATLGIPAITVELKTHATMEWEQNLAGIKALLGSF